MSRGSASEFQRSYLAALKKHLAAGPRTSLRAAGTLGRDAVDRGIGPAGLATHHTRALKALLEPGDTSRTINRALARANAFLAAALEPIHRARGPLARELARRKTLEAALGKSKLQHAKLQRRSLRVQEQFRRLTRGVLSAQEDERRRISRELHDEIGQTLTAINVKLATLELAATVDAKAVKQTVRESRRLLENSMKRVHRFARALRPPVLDDLGLVPALHAHLNAFTKQTGIPVRFVSFAEVEKLDIERRTVLYRVAQEAFANIAKHAHATLVTMSIRTNDGAVAVAIHDNGTGFDVVRRLRSKRLKRLGLLGMRERVEMIGGRFEIESAPDLGTTVRAQLPLDGRKPMVPSGPGVPSR